MSSPRLALLLALLVPAGVVARHDQVVSPADDILVSTTWLAGRLNDPDLVILEVGPREAYDAGHIPGAQFADLMALSAPHNMSMSREAERERDTTLALELPTTSHLDSVLSAFGISNDSRVVVYFNEEWLTPAARVFLTLDYAGLRGRVYYLDGGTTAWKAENRPVNKDVPAPRRGSFHSATRNDVVVNSSFVKAHLRDPAIRILDARDAEFYSDTHDNGMKRGGHIAGAGSVPFGTLVDTLSMRFKSKAELSRMFAEQGVRPGATIVSYCHIGQQGSLLYFAARYLGYEARLYDGSFQDWSRHAELPVEGARRAAGSGN
ncbi:MAG: sulfurtransferase [Gemmatimonadota bacterium]